MKTFVLTILLALLYFLNGCENVDVVEAKIEYKGKIVVASEITAGSIFPGVTITRTLPIDEPFDTNKALITNAISYIRINYVKIVPLHYRGNGHYMSLDSLDAVAGDVYELFGDIEGKSVCAKTIVPHRPAISSALIETDYLQASITPIDGEVYGARWIVYSPVSGLEIDAAEEFSSVIGASGINSSASLSVRTTMIPQLYRSSAYSDKIYVEVSSFDMAYQDYYNSRSNQQVVNNTFIQGGGSVAWNVYGDQVIGLFIGLAKNKLKVN